MSDENHDELDPIGIGDLEKFSINRNTNELYYRGRKVQTERVLSLEKSQLLWAIGFGTFGVIVGLITIFYSIVEIAKDAYHWNGFSQKSAVVSQATPAITVGNLNICPSVPIDTQTKKKMPHSKPVKKKSPSKTCSADPVEQ